MSSLKAETLGTMLQGGRIRLDAISDEARQELRELGGQAALRELDEAGPRAYSRLPQEYRTALARNLDAATLRNFQRQGTSALPAPARDWLRLSFGDARLAELRRIAGASGTISGDQLQTLFRWLDRFDNDGSRSTIALTGPRPPQAAAPGATPLPQQPAAARALRRVVEGFERDRSYTQQSFVSGYREGRFDLSRLEHLTPAERQALEQSGALAKLRELSRNGAAQLEQAQLRALFRRIDRLDNDGSQDSVRVRTGGPVQFDEGLGLKPTRHAPERITSAGEAISALNRLFIPDRAPDVEAPPAHRADVPTAPVLAEPIGRPSELAQQVRPIDKDTFAEHMRDARIDVAALARDPDAVRRLAELNLPLATLQQIARGNRDQHIGGPNAEMARLFAALQRVEDPRRPSRALNVEGPAGETTRTGEALGILDRFTTRHRVITRDGMRDELSSGRFDLRKLDEVPADSDPADTRTRAQRLIALGRTPAERQQIERTLQGIRRFGNDSQRLNGDRVADRLYELLRPVNGTPLRPGTLTLEVSHNGERAARTPVGQAYDLITGSMSYFGHSQRVYRNAEHALTGETTRVALNARRVNQMDLPRPWEACFRAAQMMISSVNREARVMQDGEGHWVARTERPGSNAVSASTEDLQAARRYIDWALDNGLPPMIGVARAGGTNVNRDNITDHYVVITGRETDERGRIRYTYNDPGKREANYFYVDPNTSMMYVPVGHGVGLGGYQLTHIRPFARVPASTGMARGSVAEHFRAVTGHRMRGA